ncbi:MAG: hypothetical protein ACI4TK_14945 [Agathobacter sp.]
MLGRKKELELPPIDIRYKVVRGFFGRKKKIATSKKEQREIKRKLLEKNPHLKFIDDLHERNSVKVDELSWIDEIEAINAMLDD